VNDGAGNLSGFAWGENIGWIDFDTSDVGGSQVTIDGGQFQGFAWAENVGWINMNSGFGVVAVLPSEGEGEGEGRGGGEGGDGEAEFDPEGEGEGLPDRMHSADTNEDGAINLGELLRVIQLYNVPGYECAIPLNSTVDGYLAEPGPNRSCGPHAGDFAPEDWRINLSELLRVIQLSRFPGFVVCRQGEDGFCPVSR